MKNCIECWKLDDKNAKCLEQITCPKTGEMRYKWDYCEFESSDTLESLLKSGKTIIIFEERPEAMFTRQRATAQYMLGDRLHSHTVFESDEKMSPQLAGALVASLMMQKEVFKDKSQAKKGNENDQVEV